jgi:hypothetical protein
MSWALVRTLRARDIDVVTAAEEGRVDFRTRSSWP